MNVIISNKYQEMLVSLDIDVIKSINGEFEVDEIIKTFSNFYFNKMILDITAIKDYKNISNIQKLSVNLDMSKIILLLDDSPESSDSMFLSKLISMGIYNFTRNVDTLKYLIDNPNVYKDVVHLQKLDPVNFDMPTVDSGNKNVVRPIKHRMKIIGVKNITEQSGASTLIYMLKRQLIKNYKVLAIELDKNDFVLFNDKEMISTTSNNFANLVLKSKDKDIILVDLNNSNLESACNDVIYLIEPSTIKLNKLIRRNRTIFNELKDKKIILNQSLLDKKDIADFEYESKSKVFYNIPPLDDKKLHHPVLDTFLASLGFIRQAPDENDDKSRKNKGLFKF